MIPTQYYIGVFNCILLCLCILKYLQIYRDNVITRNKSILGALFLLIFASLYLGLRDTQSLEFGDTIGYANGYLANNISYEGGKRGEIVWTFFTDICYKIGLSVHTWFLLIDFIYIGCMYLACQKLLRENLYIAMLFMLSAFSFFSYGVNGLRNGVACSLVILSLSYYIFSFKGKVFAFILCLLGFYIHKSIMLPIVAFLVSYYFIKDLKWALYFWLFSIVLSLTVGSQFSTLMEPLLGFDDRLGDYLNTANDVEVMKGFSSTGFRWDFLLYSALPILLGVYVVYKKKIYNRFYHILLNTYILANAFWIIVIQAAFSNRFAYLSWFLYPLVLAYPLLKFPLWENQGKIVGWFLCGHIGFTYFMWLIN